MDFHLEYLEQERVRGMREEKKEIIFIMMKKGV